MGNCLICQENTETKFLPIYVIGSEGINICQNCEMSLIRHITEQMRVATISRKIGFKNAKMIQKLKNTKI